MIVSWMSYYLLGFVLSLGVVIPLCGIFGIKSIADVSSDFRS